MSNNLETLNILLPFNSFIKNNDKFIKVTSLRIVRNNFNSKNRNDSFFYLIDGDKIVKTISFVESVINFNIIKDKTEEMIFVDKNKKEKLILYIKSPLYDSHRENFIKSII